jgi:arylsulfatase A-like enzyme
MNRMKNIRTNWLPFLCAALALSAGGLSAAPVQPGASPNIILLESDDHHPLALGCMGGPVRTPNIDALAARGVLFRDNVCQGTMCAPSRNALITGKYPHQTGVYDNHDGAMKAGVWTFPAALQRAGYVTALVGKNHFKPAPLPPERRGGEDGKVASTRALGFDHVHSMGGKVAVGTPSWNPPADQDPDPYRAYLRGKGLLEKLETDYAARGNQGSSLEAKPSVLSEEDHQDSYIATQAIEWLRSAPGGDKPFFLWVDFVAPHPPADAPLPYATMYDWRQMPAPLPAPEGAPASGKKKVVSDEEARRFRAGYYGMVSALDAQVGRIIKALEAGGLLDNTVIVFAGDQGSMLGDLGLWGKGVFYRGSIGSPLVVAGVPGALRGAVVDRPVALIDLAPTFLELAGAAAEDIQACSGHSLAPLLTGKGAYARAAAFAEDHLNQMATDGRYKYARGKNGAMLFDLAADPQETRNLDGTLPDVEARMKRLIDDWRVATPPVLPPNGSAAKAAKQAKSAKGAQPSGAKPAGGAPAPDRSAIFDGWDKNGDDFLSLEEYRGGLSRKNDAEQRFRAFDKNGDGRLSRKEFVNPTTATGKEPQP